MPLVPLRGHLDNLDALDRPDHFAGGEVDVVVTSEVTGVVIGDALFKRRLRHIESSIGDQLLE